MRAYRSCVRPLFALAAVATLLIAAHGWARTSGGSLVPRKGGYSSTSSWKLGKSQVRHTTFFNTAGKRTGFRREVLGSSGRRTVSSRTKLQHGVRVDLVKRHGADGNLRSSTRTARGKEHAVTWTGKRSRHTIRGRAQTRTLRSYYPQGGLKSALTRSSTFTKKGLTERKIEVNYDKKGLESSSSYHSRWRLNNNVLAGHMKKEHRLGQDHMVGIRYDLVSGKNKRHSKVQASKLRAPRTAPGVR